MVENRELRATHPLNAVRFSLVWKANLELESNSESLNPDRVMSVLSLTCASEKLIFVSQGTRCPIRHGSRTWIASRARVQMWLIRRNETIKSGQDSYIKIARSLSQ